MIRKLLASLAVTSALVAPATAPAAPVYVQPSFFGVNLGASANLAPWPMVAGTMRAYATGYNTDYPVCSWPFMQASAGASLNVTECKALLSTAIAAGARPILDPSRVPSWENSVAAITGSQITSDYQSFLASLVAAMPKGLIWEAWNEVQGQPYWLGTDSDMSLLAASSYATIKAADPTALIEQPSDADSPDSTGAAIPKSMFYHMDKFFQGCTALGKPCFDVLNTHAYVPGISASGATTPSQAQYAPEQIIALLANTRAVAAANGFSGLPLDVNEGWAASGAGAFNSDTDAYAGQLADLTLLIAGSGANLFDVFAASPASIGGGGYYPYCGGTYTLGLTRACAAYRNIEGWLAGGAFSAPANAWRIHSTNLVRSAPNVGATAGLVAGSGSAACTAAGAPSGTGALPSHWTAYTAESGMSVYVVGSGTDSAGLSYIDIQECGTDTTPGTGTGSVQITYDAGIAATVGQSLTFGRYLGRPAGTLTGVAGFSDQITEDSTPTGGYLGNTHKTDAYPVAQPLSGQYSEFRTPVLQATTAYVQPGLVISNYYNSTTPIAINATFRIAAPDLEVGADQYEATLASADGQTRYVAWDSSGNSSTLSVPAGYGFDRDVYNGEHAISGGLVTLSQSPILIEQSPKGFLF